MASSEAVAQDGYVHSSRKEELIMYGPKKQIHTIKMLITDAIGLDARCGKKKNAVWSHMLRNSNGASDCRPQLAHDTQQRGLATARGAGYEAALAGE